jgi:hypothetical protein
MSVTTLEAAPRLPRRRVLRGLPWVTWRQHRVALIGALLVLGGIGAFLVVNGLAMHHAFRQYGLTTCGRHLHGRLPGEARPVPAAVPGHH